MTVSPRSISFNFDVAAQAKRRGHGLAGVFHATPPNTRAAFHLVVAVLVLAALAVAYAVTPQFYFPLDDAYITLHNALSLLAGRDPNYLGVDPLTGATSLVHLGLVAAAIHIAPPVAASYGIGALGVVGYVAALAQMTFQRGGSPLAAVVVVLLGVFTGYMPLQILNGLESGLAAAAVAWAIVLADRPAPSRAIPALCGLLPFIRPELAVLSIGLMVRHVWWRWNESGSRAAGLKAVAADLGLATAVALPWVGWSAVETGALLPNTAGAKVAFFAETLLPVGTRLARVLGALTLAGLLPALIGLFLARANALTVVLRVCVLVLAGLFVWRFPGGLSHNYFRYSTVFIPFGIYGLLRMAVTRSDLLGRLVLVAALATGVVYGVKTVSMSVAATADARPLPKVAEWAALHLPRDATVLIHDAGYIAYATPLHLVDVVGLKTPDATAIHQAITQPSGGGERARAVSLIAYRHAATHAIILDDDGGYWNGIADDLRRQGWTLSPLFSTGGSDAYVVYRLTPPVTPPH